MIRLPDEMSVNWMFPVTECPVTECPVTECPVTECPLTECLLYGNTGFGNYLTKAMQTKNNNLETVLDQFC